jgi:hypothetical protein
VFFIQIILHTAIGIESTKVAHYVINLAGVFWIVAFLRYEQVLRVLLGKVICNKLEVQIFECDISA